MTKNRVLIPLDGSEFSERILRAVTCFLAPAECDLILLRVVHAPHGTVGRPSRLASADVMVPMYDRSSDIEYTLHPVFASQEWESLISEINDEMRPLKALLEKAGFTVFTAVKSGDPGPAIVQLAEDEEIDLIAMTTHGRSGLSRIWLGSVAEHVLRNVGLPVLLVRAEEMPKFDPVTGESLVQTYLPPG